MMSSLQISDLALVHDGVELGKDSIVEPFCIVGYRAEGEVVAKDKTIIGSGAILRAGTYVYKGNRIGQRFRTGNKTNIREYNEIGDDVSVGTLSVIEHHVRIGSSVRIHTQVFIPEYCVLEDDVWIGPNVVLTNAPYPASPGAKETLVGVNLKRGCRIGANVTVLPGVTIGENSLVGAGSVVTRDLPANMICYGAPAEPQRQITEIAAYAEHPTG